jgi:hypothetical protein
MASEKKQPSGVPAAPATLIILIAVSVLIVFIVTLTFSGLFNTSRQEQTIVGLAAAATQTPIDPTNPPPTPGTLPPKRATFDISQLGKLPTRALAPGETPPSTDPRNPNVTYVAPTIPSVNPVTPSDTWITYTDPNFGFSFQYPSNWHIDAPMKPLSPSLGGGIGITIQNYDEVIQKGDKTPDQLKIEIGISPVPAQYTTLDDWVAQEKQATASEPDISYSSVEHLLVDNTSAIRWTVRAPMMPQGQIRVAFQKGQRLYTIDTYPATSKQLSALDRIVSSFQIP